MTYHALELLVATYNQGKIREVEDGLAALPVKFRYLTEFANVYTVSEDGQTYRENAILKALGYAKQTGLRAVADDSGLEVDALGGRPGVFSARFGGEKLSDGDRIRRLLFELSEQANQARSARFVCCMAFAGWESSEELIRGDQPRLLTVTEGRCEGLIAPTPRGANGFGFDPVFVPIGYQDTFAQLPLELKARISHRGQALGEMQRFVSRWLDIA
jgi:XTP/dITP diphosphohydrolase